MSKKSRNLKRYISLLLAILLLFIQEVPAYAEELPALNDRLIQEKEQQKAEEERLLREEELFAPKEAISLSENTPDQDASLSGPSRTEDDILTEEIDTILRMPDLPDRDNPDMLYGEPVETGRNYKTYELPDGTCKTIFTSYPNTYMDGTQEKPIDNTLVSENSLEGETYTNKENDIKITLSAGGNEKSAVTISTEEMKAVLEPEDGDYTKAAVSENALRYNDVYENVDIQYTIQPDGFK